MKWQRVFAALGLVGVLALILCGTARADDSSLGAVGSSVIPLQNDQITMAAEQVDAEIRGNQAWVTCVFTFTNSGPRTTVLMGFPQMTADPYRLGEAPELLDFRAEVDGKAVKAVFKEDFREYIQGQSVGEYAGWYTFNVTFAAGQTRTVRNTYHGRLTFISDGSRGFSYVLHTGATWKGTIGRADITVRWLSDKDVLPGSVIAYPTGYQVSDRELSWHFSNLEPTPDNDINVFVQPDYGSQAQVPGMPRTGLGESSGPPMALLIVAVIVTLTGVSALFIFHK